MSTVKLSGWVVGDTIKLDDALPALEGKRVNLIVEEDEDPVARAVREAPLDDREVTEEERAAIEEGKRGPFVTTEELRARLAAARSSSK